MVGCKHQQIIVINIIRTKLRICKEQSDWGSQNSLVIEDNLSNSRYMRGVARARCHSLRSLFVGVPISGTSAAWQRLWVTIYFDWSRGTAKVTKRRPERNGGSGLEE